MSAPEPLTVTVPPEIVALPATPTVPMSWLVHGPGSDVSARSTFTEYVPAQSPVNRHAPLAAAGLATTGAARHVDILEAIPSVRIGRGGRDVGPAAAERARLQVDRDAGKSRFARLLDAVRVHVQPDEIANDAGRIDAEVGAQIAAAIVSEHDRSRIGSSERVAGRRRDGDRVGAGAQAGKLVVPRLVGLNRDPPLRHVGARQRDGHPGKSGLARIVQAVIVEVLPHEVADHADAGPAV